MGLESVVEDVLGRGRSEVEEIRRAALAERDRILQNARAEGAKLVEIREQEARKAVERLRVQALARAELESKKIVLSAEKDLLDKVYAKVLEKLAVLEDGGAILQSLLKARAADWRTGNVYCNEKDATAVRAVGGPRKRPCYPRTCTSGCSRWKFPRSRGSSGKAPTRRRCSPSRRRRPAST